MAKNATVPAVVKTKVSGYASASTGSSVTVADTMSIAEAATVGYDFSKVRRRKNDNQLPYVFINFSDELLKAYDLGEGNDSLLVNFTMGAKAILEDTGDRLSKSRMELVEATTTDDNDEEVSIFLIRAVGEEIGGGKGELVD